MGEEWLPLPAAWTKCELGTKVDLVSLPRILVCPQPTRSTLPTTSVLPVRKVTMSPGVKGSLKSSNMPPKKLAAISLGEEEDATYLGQGALY